jgi:hypothetical protein
VVAPSRAVSPRLLVHELFHILSRSNPALRDRLYETIGFVNCAEVEWPESLRRRKLTNPDAPGNGHCIRVQVSGAEAWAVPILLARTEKYDVQRGGAFFRYMQSQLLLVDRAGDSPAIQPSSTEGQPRLIHVEQVTGFFEQIGRNTQYIIHPEEILADNFASLVLQDQNLPSPEVLEKMQKVLTAEPPK